MAEWSKAPALKTGDVKASVGSTPTLSAKKTSTDGITGINACSILDADTKVSAPAEPFKLKQFRRHDRQSCIRQMVDRKYLLDGKVVATNRHKSIEQKSDSLEEFREAYGDAAVSQLTVKPHPPQYKDISRIMPGAVMDFNGTVGVFQGSSGRNNGTPNYYNSTKGARVLTKRCALLAKNAGMVFIPA